MRPKEIKPYIFYICCTLMAIVILIDRVKLHPRASIAATLAIGVLWAIHIGFRAFKHRLPVKALAIGYGLNKIVDAMVIAGFGAYLHHRWTTQGAASLLPILSIVLILFCFLFFHNYREFIKKEDIGPS